MYLIYINKVGKDWEGNYIYEFLFSSQYFFNSSSFNATEISFRLKILIEISSSKKIN